MIKRLTKHGNSLALVIDRPVLDLLNINAETALKIRTDGQCLTITPVPEASRQKKFRRALGVINRRYGRALKELAE